MYFVYRYGICYALVLFRDSLATVRVFLLYGTVGYGKAEPLDGIVAADELESV